jgi:GT2 family glycosyltransferase
VNREELEPLVSIIIPHYLGDILSECLAFIYERTAEISFEVIVADDQPYDDGSLDRAREKFPEIRTVKTGGGNGKPTKGMGAGCNRGLEVARGQYAMLLNSDVEVAEGWLPPLIAALASDASIGACQPKVRSLRDRSMFDYGGAAGGLMDKWGFTFCQGRLFESVEEDFGQYDERREIFWAVGGAMFLRMACLEHTGQMDEAFVMHMEEIDLCWRFHLAGYRIVYVPESVIYHYGGFSLEADSYKKASFNHRNQLVMLLKNLSFARLCYKFPVRVAMELANLVLLFKGNWKHPLAAFYAIFWVFLHPLQILRRRRETQRLRQVSDREIDRSLFNRSVVFCYFVRGIKTVQQLGA